DSYMSAKGFDRIAFIYDWLARLVYGDGILHAATLGMTEVREGDKVLILGGGSGKLLSYFRPKHFPGEIVYVEPSREMMAKAQKVWNSLEGSAQYSIQWVLDTDDFVQGKEEYDVLITPFVLDLFPEEKLAEVFSRLDHALKAGGTWLYADFFLKEDAYLLLRRMLVWLMYTFFRMICGIENRKLPQTGKLFKEKGFLQIQRKEFSSAMIEGIIYQKS
ncbi:MAG: class I SAM-dependent methyltransferase, partial [Bacteroidota bacterium]